MQHSFLFSNGTRKPKPPVPFSRIKEEILGTSYELSVALVGVTRMRALNRTHRTKDVPTDILAFPLEKNRGEIILHVDTATKKSHTFGLSPTQYLTYVFIHGCLHLKGMDHGRTMEKQEDVWCARFGIPSPKR